MMVPPELLLRLPAIVRFIHQVTDKDSGTRRRQSDEEGSHTEAHSVGATGAHDADIVKDSEGKDDPSAYVLSPLSAGSRRVKIAPQPVSAKVSLPTKNAMQ